MISLVKFSNGKFGIRRGWLFREYKSFNNDVVVGWVKKDDVNFHECMTNEARARGVFRVLTNNKEIITEQVIE